VAWKNLIASISVVTLCCGAETAHDHNRPSGLTSVDSSARDAGSEVCSSILCAGPEITPASRDPLDGFVTGWRSSCAMVTVDEKGVAGSAGQLFPDEVLQMWWSGNQFPPDERSGAYFYSSEGSKVAFAARAGAIEDIEDAASLDYQEHSVGPVYPGEFAVYRHERWGFLAIRVDGFYLDRLRDTPEDCEYNVSGDFTFFFDSTGTGDFRQFEE
jgi:hypothetical protein